MSSTISRLVLHCAATSVLLFSNTSVLASQSVSPTRFTVTVHGRGPDVVLLPGLGSSSEVWRAQVEQLKSTHRLHVIHVNGFAGRPAPARRDTILAPLVNELAQYIRVNTLNRPAIIGQSLGGLLGVMLSRKHPELLGRLMIVDALPFYSALFGPQVTVAAVEPQARALRDQLIALDSAAFAAQQRMGVTRLVKTPTQHKAVVEWSITSDRELFARAMYEVMTTDMRPEVASLRTPITVVYAYDPAMGPSSMIDGLYRGGYATAPNVQFVRIDGSYHFIMFDQPRAFQEAVKGFLQ